MIGTAVLATVAVSLLVFGAVTAGIVAAFRALERDRYRTTGRRKLARGTFGFGAVLSLTALVSLATTFTLDVGPVLGTDPLMAGVGTVVVAAIPLTVGLALAIDEDALD